jgi:hypothetical protein
MPPRGIVGGGGYSLTFLSGCVRGSFSPVGKQHVKLDNSCSIDKRSRHVHAESRGFDRRTRRNAPGNIERKHTAAKFSHVRSTGEQVKTDAIAAVAVSGNVLVECVVLAGSDGNHPRVR